MEFGCIGETLKHSFSKEVHSLCASYKYELKEVAKADLAAFIKDANFKGINVTIPYKEAVIPFLDSISEEAKMIGAVNTIVNKNGKLLGYNTDFYGMTALINYLKLDLKNKKVLILGSGGTSKTARAVAKSLNAKEILVVSRKAENGFITYTQAVKNHFDAQIIINTTPVGMFPKCEDTPINLSAFKNLQGVIDAVYNPLNSSLVCNAKDMGIKAMGGLYMLVAQGVKAAEIFGGRNTKTEEEIYNEILKQKQNIVLVGMPSVGKTTLGKHLSKQLNKPFFDSDQEIFKKYGTLPKDIINTKGEETFRNYEQSVIEDLSKLSGVVIATGGGVAERKTNMQRLIKNGKIILLNKPLNMLLTGGDRPLSKSPEALEKLYSKRYPLYKEYAYKEVNLGKNLQENLQKLLKEI